VAITEVGLCSNLHSMCPLLRMTHGVGTTPDAHALLQHTGVQVGSNTAKGSPENDNKNTVPCSPYQSCQLPRSPTTQGVDAWAGLTNTCFRNAELLLALP
jgi:hypothetical protein